MRLSCRDDDGRNRRVAHDVLANAALRREPASASAPRATDDEVGALLVGDTADTFANVLHCFTSHLVLQLYNISTT